MLAQKPESKGKPKVVNIYQGLSISSKSSLDRQSGTCLSHVNNKTAYRQAGTSPRWPVQSPPLLKLQVHHAKDEVIRKHTNDLEFISRQPPRQSHPLGAMVTREVPRRHISDLEAEEAGGERIRGSTSLPAGKKSQKGPNADHSKGSPLWIRLSIAQGAHSTGRVKDLPSPGVRNKCRAGARRVQDWTVEELFPLFISPCPQSASPAENPSPKALQITPLRTRSPHGDTVQVTSVT